MLTIARMSWYPSIFMLTKASYVKVRAYNDMNMHIALHKNAVSREFECHDMHLLGAYHDIQAPTITNIV